MDGGEYLEHGLAPEPLKGAATGSVLLHLGLIAGVVIYGIIGGFFHHNLWGGSGAGGAIQVSIVSNALPLPSTQPVNQNVLATETPSQAPAAPTPKTEQKIDETAIPIQGKQKKPEKQTQQRNVVKPVEPVPQNRADYGEQTGSSLPHASQSAASGPATVNDASFGALFAWYVNQIDRKMDANGYRALADPRTPKGARAYIEFPINRDGSHGNVLLDRSSGSPTWDSACVRAAQRVDTFGALPAQYRANSLQVSFYCEY